MARCAIKVGTGIESVEQVYGLARCPNLPEVVKDGVGICQTIALAHRVTLSFCLYEVG